MTEYTLITSGGRRTKVDWRVRQQIRQTIRFAEKNAGC